MKTYKQYLEESYGKKIGMGAAALGVALGLRHLGNTIQPSTEEPRPIPRMAAAAPPPIKTEQPQQLAKSKKSPQQLSQRFHDNLKSKFGKEYDTIMDAATSNGIAADDHENLSILFAIRRHENGRPGREFGVLRPGATTLRKQAGEAAFALMKSRKAWNPKKQPNFITHLGSTYSPVGAENDPKNSNKNWIPGVSAIHNEHMSFLNDESDD